jgi:hypothetical protein
MGLFSKLFKRKNVFQKIDESIDIIKHGVYLRLLSKYNAKYDFGLDGLLAAAVTNEMFSEFSSSVEGKEFQATHRDLIDKELYLLKSEEEIKNIISSALRIRMKIIYETQTSGSYDKDLGKPYAKLRSLGLADHDAEIPTPEKFISMAEKFFKSSQ